MLPKYGGWEEKKTPSLLNTVAFIPTPSNIIGSFSVFGREHKNNLDRIEAAGEDI